MKAHSKLFSIPARCGLIVFTLLMCQLGAAQAAAFYWDTDTSAAGNNVNGAGLGGAGEWDLTTSNWWDGAVLGL
ncbi:hypothetical protein, partial [Prosthecobacter sp.]|uniref:hypothetical protein n=1 Tax=Prosthecobacter sp. TaxID=1965333 RepID=UPI00248A190A